MSLDKYVKAQENDYDIALSEIRNGNKESHWMWYIFPQIAGLGRSYMDERYSIKSIEEAKDYMAHELLGKRLVEISSALLTLDTDDARAVMHSPDHLKLRSSMTLFSMAAPDEPVFQKVLDKYYGGQPDEATIKILSAMGK